MTSDILQIVSRGLYINKSHRFQTVIVLTLFQIIVTLLLAVDIKIYPLLIIVKMGLHNITVKSRLLQNTVKKSHKIIDKKYLLQASSKTIGQSQQVVIHGQLSSDAARIGSGAVEFKHLPLIPDGKG